MKTFPFWGLRRRSAPFGRCAAARRHGLRERCGAATSRWGGGIRRLRGRLGCVEGGGIARLGQG
ncbi:hypothetical protein KQ308_11825 [Synechococcus sp. CS-1327]|nr:hypothetical protein [Synechococcus sp. CS-1327]